MSRNFGNSGLTLWNGEVRSLLIKADPTGMAVCTATIDSCCSPFGVRFPVLPGLPKFDDREHENGRHRYGDHHVPYREAYSGGFHLVDSLSEMKS